MVELAPTCAICGRALKDPRSLKRGIGPICRRRIHPESHSRPSRRRHHTSSDQFELPLSMHSPVTPIESDPLDIPNFLRRTT
jgi:hypothetical protein